MTALSSKASDTILSSYRVRLPFGPGSAPGALPIALPRLDNLPRLRDEPDARRKRLWELSPTLHCSIIGTCLAQGELREILRRIARSEGLDVAGLSDHDLHSLGVRLAERRDGPGKLLHKALDRRHAAAIKAFAAAKDESALEAQWQAALASGAIPGGYWALLTHPCCSKRLVIRAFGEVHMLSHLVGSSNRADIARLRALEEDNAQLQAELSSQRRGWRHALAERDARVRRLEEQLHALPAAPAAPEPSAGDHDRAGSRRPRQAGSARGATRQGKRAPRRRRGALPRRRGQARCGGRTAGGGRGGERQPARRSRGLAGAAARPAR